MPWNPVTYDQFKENRYKPFFDLLDLISGNDIKTAVDLGCGTGEQTSILAEKFPSANFLGIDSSAEMLSGTTKLEHERLRFSKMSIREFVSTGSNWDLIFSNAALQWTDDHRVLFPELISKLNNQGQLAVQMPFQNENILNRILLDMVQEKPYSEILNGYTRISPVLKMDDYASILFTAGLQNITVLMKVYPIIADSEVTLYDFISGSALIPYMERMDAAGQERFKVDYLERIKAHFGSFPAIYPFKRLLLHGIKE